MNMNRPRSLVLWATAAVVALVAAGITVQANFAKEDNKASVREETLPVVAASRRDINEVVAISGEFRPYQEVELDAKVRGYVQKLSVDVGDVVKKGAVLATLEIPELRADLARAEASVAVARQQAVKARAQNDDAKALYDRLLGVMKERPALIAQQDLDAARAKANAEAAAQVAAEAAIVEAEANRTRERDIGDYARIVAPFDGVVTRRYIDEGALVGATTGVGQPVFHISEIDRMRLVINVPEASVPDVAVGAKAQVTIGALGKRVELQLSRVSHQLSMDTRTMHAEFDYDNPTGEVAAGMYAEVALPLKQRNAVTAVPLRALRDRNGDAGHVYVLDAKGNVAQRNVKLGLIGTTDVEIVSGVTDGELVVVDVLPRIEPDVHYVARRLDGEVLPNG